MSSVNSLNSLVWLERFTAGILILVIVILGWIMLAAEVPEAASWLSEEFQVIAILALLSAALILVSVVALLHTRGKD